MFGSKCFQVAVLAFAGIGLGLAPAGDAAAGSRNNDRSYNDRSHHQSRNVSHHSRNVSHRDHSHRHHSHRDQSRSRVSATYRNDNVRFSVSIGSRSSDRGYHSPPIYRGPSCDRTVVVYNPPPSGHWERVYRSPVYETRYDACGRAYRVCVRAGYYERVWVSTNHRY